ncbi:hypothetical protein D3C80_1671970 [compost metagenome]
MQVHQFIGHRRGAFQHHGHQSGVAPFVLELAQILRRHLPTFTGQLEQAVLVNVPVETFRQGHQLEDLQPLDVFHHVPRIRFQR